MMHNACITAFRNQNRGGHRGGSDHRPHLSPMPRPTAVAEQQVHQCERRQASAAAHPAFYTLCGYLVPEENVELTCLHVTCPQCLRRAGETG